MSKLLLIIFGIVVVWWILKWYRKSMTREAPPPAAAEDMVRCSHCGVHLPRSESHTSGDEFFCSEEHLRLRR